MGLMFKFEIKVTYFSCYNRAKKNEMHKGSEWCKARPQQSATKDWALAGT